MDPNHPVKLHNLIRAYAFQQYSMILYMDSKGPDRTVGMHNGSIVTDKALFFIKKMLISFLFLHENICCGTH